MTFKAELSDISQEDVLISLRILRAERTDCWSVIQNASRSDFEKIKAFDSGTLEIF